MISASARSRVGRLMLVAGLGAGLIIPPLALPSLAGAQKAPVQKTDVCHLGDGGTWSRLTLPVPAVAAHLKHGDALPGQEVPGQVGYAFDSDCVPTGQAFRLCTLHLGDTIDNDTLFSSEDRVHVTITNFTSNDRSCSGVGEMVTLGAPLVLAETSEEALALCGAPYNFASQSGGTFEPAPPTMFSCYEIPI